MNATKSQILDLLRAFAAQRPGLEFANYGDVRAWRAESRAITRDLHDARELLRAVEWRDGIDADALREAFRAFSGRLTLDESGAAPSLDYCTGQYFPTEYRKAVCAVCASALWNYYRDHCMPSAAQPSAYRAYVKSPGDWLRATFKREFSARLARRWFN